MTDHVVKNIFLSDFGRKKLSIAEIEMLRLVVHLRLNITGAEE